MPSGQQAPGTLLEGVVVMSSPRLEFRFRSLPLRPCGRVDALVESAVRAGQAGIDSVTVPDLPGGLSPLVALATVARATDNIRLGPFVLNTGLWNPATVARESPPWTR